MSHPALTDPQTQPYWELDDELKASYLSIMLFLLEAHSNGRALLAETGRIVPDGTIQSASGLFWQLGTRRYVSPFGVWDLAPIGGQHPALCERPYDGPFVRGTDAPRTFRALVSFGRSENRQLIPPEAVMLPSEEWQPAEACIDEWQRLLERYGM